MSEQRDVEVEIAADLYAEAKLRADAQELSVQEYIEQALSDAFSAEDAPLAYTPADEDDDLAFFIDEADDLSEEDL